MKAYTRILVLFGLLFIYSSCEDDIFPELEPAPAQVVVDAWINNKPEQQIIKLTNSQSYYDSTIAPGIVDARVYITDLTGKRYDFTGGFDGSYTWSPTVDEPTFGEIGMQYVLNVETQDGEIYTAASAMNRVPPIDSVTFRFEEAFGPIPDSYFAEFFANDPEGVGDTYWIRTYKNGEYLSKPSEISLAYDAGFSAGSTVDGITFIQPIRDSINPFDQDENDNFLSPYEVGDTVFVELHSITNDAWNFMLQVQIQTDRPGGFAELFATPLSNVPTNIIRTVNTDGIEPLGFFNVAAVSSAGNRLDQDDLPPMN